MTVAITASTLGVNAVLGCIIVRFAERIVQIILTIASEAILCILFIAIDCLKDIDDGTLEQRPPLLAFFNAQVCAWDGRGRRGRSAAPCVGADMIVP